MPEHLVERINASLAAEQAQRTGTMSIASVTPLPATDRVRRAGLLLILGRAAAAVAIVAAVGTSLFVARQTSTSSTTASVATQAEAGARAAQAPPNAAGEAQGPNLGSITPGDSNKGSSPRGASVAPPLTQIGLSGTRYTPAGFVMQAETLLHSAPGPIQPRLAQPPALGPAATTSGLKECLNALGAGGAQVVRADVATYQGQPALIIVATTNGASVAYAVGRRCSRVDPAVLRPATPLS